MVGIEPLEISFASPGGSVASRCQVVREKGAAAEETTSPGPLQKWPKLISICLSRHHLAITLRFVRQRAAQFRKTIKMWLWHTQYLLRFVAAQPTDLWRFGYCCRTAIGKGCCGCLPTSPPVAAVPPATFSRSYTGQQKKPRWCFKEPYIPGLKSGALYG